MDTFLEGKLNTTESKVSFKNMFAVLNGLHESNPFDVAADQNNLIECFKTNCVFSK